MPEISFNFPDMNQLCLPVAVPVPCNKILPKNEVMERLRNKVTNVAPYKKIHKQEVPTMPQTPVEEMQKLQIMLGTSDRMAKDEHDGMYCLVVLILYISVNSFGHVETVSSHSHTFSCLSLIKRLTSTSCTHSCL